MRIPVSVVIAVAAACLLSACQQTPKSSGASGASGKSAALRSMERVAAAAYKCWFASKDQAFRPYRFANELNSMSGQPRFLLVPAGNFGGLPQLVVQSSGPSGRVDVFGPLTSTGLGPRIRSDIARWSGGNDSCQASA